MKLGKACILSKEIAESEETKREVRTKPSRGPVPATMSNAGI